MTTATQPNVRQHQQRGVSLIESLMALAITSLVLGSGLPGFAKARETRRIEAIAAQLETDIQQARSAAVARGASVRISFDTSAPAASCYVVHTGNAGDCRCDATGLPLCRPGAQALHAVRVAGDSGVRLVSNVASMLMDADRATVTPTATVKVQGGSGAIHQVVNIMGRVRSCSPAPALPGYKVC